MILLTGLNSEGEQMGFPGAVGRVKGELLSNMIKKDSTGLEVWLLR
jgi:hypothetical protein